MNGTLRFEDCYFNSNCHLHENFWNSSIPHICTQTWHVCLNPWISDVCLKMCRSKRRNLKAHLLCNVSLTMPYVLESDPPFIACTAAGCGALLQLFYYSSKRLWEMNHFFHHVPTCDFLSVSVLSHRYFIFPISVWTRMGMLHDGISFICKFIKSEPANSFLLSEWFVIINSHNCSCQFFYCL